MRLSAPCRQAHFLFPPKFFQKIFKLIGIVLSSGTGGYEREVITTFANAKGGETMNEPIRTQWQIRCAFNGYCKRALQNEMLAAKRDIKRRQRREVTFSDLTSQEEKQLFVCDQYFADDEAEKSFVIAGKEITAKLLAEALHSLPEEKREAVLLYYFFDMSDVEIAKLHNIPRSTVQYRRTSSFELLKRYLEERAYDENEW